MRGVYSSLTGNFLFTLLFLAIQPIAVAQANQHREYDSTFVDQAIDELTERHGRNKELPEKYTLSFLIALSQFPELDDAYIRFKETRIKTTLNARPTVGSLLFRSKKKRRYVIRINTEQQDSAILLNSVPFNARIGLFGHELCHFMDYRERSFFGVVGRLFAYGSKSGKERFEKEIDSLTIVRGLGWQLYDWSSFVLHNSTGSADYKQYKRRYYLEPAEIEAIIKSSEQ